MSSLERRKGYNCPVRTYFFFFVSFNQIGSLTPKIPILAYQPLNRSPLPALATFAWMDWIGLDCTRCTAQHKHSTEEEPPAQRIQFSLPHFEPTVVPPQLLIPSPLLFLNSYLIISFPSSSINPPSNPSSIPFFYDRNRASLLIILLHRCSFFKFVFRKRRL